MIIQVDGGRTIKNMNKLVRQYIPEIPDFRLLTDEYIKKV